MIPRHRALGSREDSARRRLRRSHPDGRPAAVAVAKEVPGMADVAYVLVFAGGFALLALMLRGLERL